jgi:hypothetical protein
MIRCPSRPEQRLPLIHAHAAPSNAVHATNWQTPRGDGQRLIDPAASSWLDVAAQNRAALAVQDYDVQGIALAKLAAQARRQLWQAAYDATLKYRSVDTALVPAEREPLFLIAGHQPEIFHPGVWLKNALLSQAAAEHPHELVPINLVIDSDLVKSTSLRVPGGTAERPRWAPIAFDRGPAEVPWEVRAVADLEQLASWPTRMLAARAAAGTRGIVRRLLAAVARTRADDQ